MPIHSHMLCSINSEFKFNIFSAAIVAGILGKYNDIPVISWAATFAELKDVVRFPTSARTVGSTEE